MSNKKQTSRDFYKHSGTGEIYAIETAWDGTVVGSCGPLAQDHPKDLDSYEYTPERNSWLKDANDKLILI